MSARIQEKLTILVSGARSRMSSLSRLQLGLATAGALAIAAGAAIGIVLFAPVGGGGDRCDEPLCVDVLGPGGDEVHPMTPVRIRLTGDIDRRMVSRALLISNDPRGEARFEDDVLTFRPQWPGFARGVRYNVALSIPGEQVPSGASPVDIKFAFTTDGKLQVSSVFPPDGAQEIALDGAVMLQFNRSVAPITVIDSRGPQGVVEFAPPVEGTGRWLNTSLYTFVPGAAGWAPATTYHARVKAGLANQLGGTLDRDYVFTFSTLSPAIAAVTPGDNTKFVAPQPEIRVTFNQPVNRASAEANFALVSTGGAPVPGRVDWPDDRTLVFRPSALALATAYEGVARAGVRALNGQASTAADFRWRFETIGVPRITLTEPSNGATAALRYGLRIVFSNPMDRKSVEDNISVTPELAGTVYYSWDSDDTTLYAGVSLETSSLYRVTLTGAKDRYGQPLAEPLDLRFTTEQLTPGFSIFRGSRSGTFNAYLEPQIIATSWNVRRLDFALYNSTPGRLLSYEDGSNGMTGCGASGLSQIRTWSEPIVDPPLDTTVVTTTKVAEGGGRLPEGVYELCVTAPETTGSDVLPFVVSSANVVTKWTDEDLLVWAADLQTGAPLQIDFEVLEKGATRVAGGSTGSDGVGRVTVGAPADNSYWPGYYVHAEQDGRVILSGTNWNDGIGPWTSDIPFQFTVPDLVGHLFTDRPIYRPGETVHIKGVVRQDDDADYAVPDGAGLGLEIRDSNGRLLESRDVTLSDMGTFDTDFSLSTEATTGGYSAVLMGAPSPTPYGPFITAAQFQVAEFRKPEFEVSVEAERDAYVSGDTVSADVRADLFFGSPLANAALTWQVTSQQFLFYSDDYPGFAFSDYQYGNYDYRDGPFYEQQQRVREQGVGTTGADGTFVVSAPADLSSDPVSQTFTMEATVTDQNGQSATSSQAVVVHKGRFYIGMKPEGYVSTSGAGSVIDLVTLDTEGGPALNVPLTVRVFKREWRTVRERASDGEQRYVSEPEDTLVQTLDAVTGGDAEGRVAFTPTESGQYHVTAEATDAAGNTIKSAVDIWVSSSEYASWYIGNDDLIELVADKDEYRPGETAKILVAAPFEESAGLVTEERGKLLTYGVRDFAKNSEIIEVPITSALIPNVFVSVALLKPPTADNPMPQARFGTVELRVSTDEKKLNIAIEPEGDRFEPRDKVTYRIRTTDSNGHGVPAEVSLALVDEAVLSLQDEFSRPPIEAFWSRRYLGVITASTFAVSIDRANELNINRLQMGGKGGGGGPGDETRTFFPNTAYWNAALRTAADGTASVEVQLPDTLTRWRMTARGITDDTKTGEATHEIVTSKEIIVRPAVPRFLVADDKAMLGAIVHNFTGAPLDIDVTLDAEGVSLEGDATQRVTVQPGTDTIVRWNTRAQAGRDGAKLRFEARADEGASDAVALTLPLYAYFTPETVGTAGEVTDEGAEAIELPYYVRPDAGELTVGVSPSLTAGLNTAAEYIEESPYESAETTVSRLLARLTLTRAAKTLGLEDVDADEGIDALIQRSVQRLYGNQSYDGGWGWYEGDDSDAAITAYVLIGLAEVKRHGRDIDPYVEESAVAYLRGQLDLARDVFAPKDDLRAFVLYALARFGHGDLGRSYAMAEQRTTLSNTAKAWVALAVAESGGDDSDPRLTGLLSDLQTSAVASATGNHWEDTVYNREVFSNSTAVTAQVLQAFTRFQPEHPLVDGTVRWLMVARKEGHWESTHDTALALLAITDFMLVRNDVQASFDYTVELNGDSRLKGRAEAGSVQQSEQVVIELKDLIKGEVNALRIKRSPADAVGRLYYTAHLRYFTPAEEIEAASYGIGVSHEYFSRDGSEPLHEVTLGDVVRVKVTLVAEADLNFLVLEDYLPAGLEPIDTSLKTTSGELRRRLFEEQRKAYQVSKQYSPFGHTDIRDNRVALFARYVPKGVYEYTYFAQATTPGEFRIAPATAFEQYFPEVWGRSDGATFTVSEPASARLAIGP